VHRHENVGRFDVAVNDGLLVSVLDRLTDWYEKLKTLLGR
jgi:hypothetical protein